MAIARRSTGITIHGDTYPFISPPRYRASLSGKVVLITGASRGIGRATCLAFAQAGAHVAALARTSSALDTLISEINTQYRLPALAITGDVTINAIGIIKRVEEELGSIDILINNAGMNRMARFTEEKDFTTWWRVWEVNTLAPFALIHGLIPSFRARGHGIIITLGTAVIDSPLPFLSSYVGSKAGMQKAIQVIDLELRSQGVQNFVVHPGSNVSELSAGDGSIIGREMKEIIANYLPYMTDTLTLPADSMVALAGLAEEGKAEFLSGRFWDVAEDLEELMEKQDEILTEDLYNLRLRKL
jgi:NAD(P)-dependent dehydrogenase (short-subunit alcohol dehydrogenase family)